MPPRVGTPSVVAVRASTFLIIVGKLYEYIVAFPDIGFDLVPEAFVDK